MNLIQISLVRGEYIFKFMASNLSLRLKPRRYVKPHIAHFFFALVKTSSTKRNCYLPVRNNERLPSITDDRVLPRDRRQDEIHAERSFHRYENATQAVLQVGLQFEGDYSIEKKSKREVQYADSREIEATVFEKYPPKSIPA